MSGGELRRLRDALGWSARDLTQRLGCSKNLVAQWEGGLHGGPPVAVLAWLRDVLAVVEARPPPAGWRRPNGRRAARLARGGVAISLEDDRVRRNGVEVYPTTGPPPEVPVAASVAMVEHDPAPPALPVGAMGYVRAHGEGLVLYGPDGVLMEAYGDAGFEVVRDRLGQRGCYLSRGGVVYPPVGS